MNTKEYVEDLMCDLRQDEWESAVRDLASADEKRQKYEAELAEQKVRYKGLIESTEARCATLMHMVRTRKERRPVRVEDLLRKDSDGVHVVATVRLDTGEEVRCRTAHPDELQKHLPGLDPAAKATEAAPPGGTSPQVQTAEEGAMASSASNPPPSPAPEPKRSRKKAPAAAPEPPAPLPETPDKPVHPAELEAPPAPATSEPAPEFGDEFDALTAENPDDADFFGSTD